MEVNKKRGVYHKTTTDTAKFTYETISSVGQKRTFDDVRDRNGSDHRVLVDVTNSVDFRRQALKDNCYPPLKAAKILDIAPPKVSEYSQRRALALTPGPTANPLLDLAHPAYGLSEELVHNLTALGIRSIYPWQSECLLRSGVLRGKRNLVYTAPTGGGKSLVADIVALKKVIECPGKKALLVLPYVALVQEKLRYLRKIVKGVFKNQQTHPQQISRWRKRGDEENVRIVGFFGGSKSNAAWADMDVAVCTIEKANSLVNAAIEDLSVGNLGVVVIDELHMVNDCSRGYILELLATKLLSLEQNVQLIGMSATLNNAELLAKWLNNAKFYVSIYRPVPIEEYLVFENVVYPASTSSRLYEMATQLHGRTQEQKLSQFKSQPTRTLQASPSKALKDPLINAVISLTYETVRAGYGALVFCSSRLGCERDAILISQVLSDGKHLDPQMREKRRDLLNDLRSTSTGLDSVLEKTIPTGAAFHHAGLTTEERELIATAYDQGSIKVLVATCSLAAGINLPARRVILHGARMGADLVGPAMLRQMKGRAGRKGKDEIGETYLCCQESDIDDVSELMQADIPPLESCLLPGKHGIRRALLEVITTKLATSLDSVDKYIKRTLLYHLIGSDELNEMVATTLTDLKEDGLIGMDGSNLEATLLGHAIVASSLTPEDGLFVHKELRKALEAFVMDGDMHVLYAFTPVQSVEGSVNWQIFRNEIEGFDESNMRTLGLVGLSPSLINKMAHGGSLKETTPQEIEVARIYKRFYAALQLRDLCNEMPIHVVAKKYDLPRGKIQNLAQTCHGFAAGMIKFCERMNWTALAAVLDHFSDRLKAGAKADLLALAQILYIKSRTARVFWENGYKTVASIAAADANDILPVLLLAQPKKLRVDSEDEEKYREKLLAKALMITESANKIWERQMQLDLEEEE